MVNKSLECIDLALGYYMVEQKISRENLASMLDMSSESLRNKRNGKTPWTWNEILKISDILGKTPDELAGLSVPV